MNKVEAVGRAVGVVTSLRAAEQGREDWREMLDAMLDDLSHTDKNDLILELAGIALAGVIVMTQRVPEFSDVSVEDYLQRLGTMAQEPGALE